MNIDRHATAHRFTAFTLALVMTLGMLGTIDLLATSEVPAAQLARAEAAAART
jgi:hypothetical protein